MPRIPKTLKKQEFTASDLEVAQQALDDIEPDETHDSKTMAAKLEGKLRASLQRGATLRQVDETLKALSIVLPRSTLARIQREVKAHARASAIRET